MTARIVPLTAEHAAQVLTIYQAGIDEGDATFETTAPTWEAFDRAKPPAYRFAAVDERGTVLGWIAAGQGLRPLRLRRGCWSTPCTSSPTPGAAASPRPCWRRSWRPRTRRAPGPCRPGIFPENAASLAVHARAGFRVVGTRERIGRHHGVWRDVVLLERRSAAVT